MIGVETFRPCPVHIGGGTAGLLCTCEAGHSFGHVFASTSGVVRCPKEEA